MRSLILLLFSALAYSQTFSVPDATYCENGSTAACSASHQVTVQAGDEIIMAGFVYGGTCATNTITPTNVAGGTWATFSITGASPGPSCTSNQWTGQSEINMFRLTVATPGTYTLAASYTLNPGEVGFHALVLRGGGYYIVPDVSGTDDETSGSATTIVAPQSGSATTTAAGIITMFGLGYTGFSITPTTNGCFGTTGSQNANTTASNWMGSQYLITSGVTGPGTCSFTLGSTLHHLGVLATFKAGSAIPTAAFPRRRVTAQ